MQYQVLPITFTACSANQSSLTSESDILFSVATLNHYSLNKLILFTCNTSIIPFWKVFKKGMWSTKTRLKNSFETESYPMFWYLSLLELLAKPRTTNVQFSSHISIEIPVTVTGRTGLFWLLLLSFSPFDVMRSILSKTVKTFLSASDKSLVVLAISLECLLLQSWQSFITYISIHNSSTCPILYSVFLLTIFLLRGYV